MCGYYAIECSCPLVTRASNAAEFAEAIGPLDISGPFFMLSEAKYPSAATAFSPHHAFCRE